MNHYLSFLKNVILGKGQILFKEFAYFYKNSAILGMT